MTNALARFYAVLIAALAFFVAWAAVAAHPWRATAKDPRLTALQERRAHLQREAHHVRLVLKRRYGAYRLAYRRREAAIARARAEQRRLDTLAAAARARYLASAPVRTVTVYTPAASTSAGTPVLASAAAPAAAPPLAAAPAAAPAPPPVVAVPAVTATHTS